MSALAITKCFQICWVFLGTVMNVLLILVVHITLVTNVLRMHGIEFTEQECTSYCIQFGQPSNACGQAHINETEKFNFVCMFLAQVFRYQIFSTCSQYNTCISCTALRDPLCGWCVVENKCSTTDQCYSSELTGRWVHTHEQCIVNVSLGSMYVALDNKSHVSFPGAFCMYRIAANLYSTIFSWFALATTIHIIFVLDFLFWLKSMLVPRLVV